MATTVGPPARALWAPWALSALLAAACVGPAQGQTDGDKGDYSIVTVQEDKCVWFVVAR